MRPTCSDPDCTAPRVKTDHNGQHWCLWHPTEQRPDIDPVTGDLRDPAKIAKIRARLANKHGRTAA